MQRYARIRPPRWPLVAGMGCGRRLDGKRLSCSTPGEPRSVDCAVTHSWINAEICPDSSAAMATRCWDGVRPPTRRKTPFLLNARRTEIGGLRGHTFVDKCRDMPGFVRRDGHSLLGWGAAAD